MGDFPIDEFATLVRDFLADTSQGDFAIPQGV
jgi:hypothetical protein